MGEWLRATGLHVEVGTAFLTGASAAFLVDRQPYVALGALAMWMVGAYHSGRAVTTPLSRQYRALVGSATLPLAAVAAGVAYLDLAATHVSEAFAAMIAAAATAVVFRTLRWRLQAPVRVVVVGDRGAVATHTSTWARTRSVQVVGGMVVEEGLDSEAVPREILGVPTVGGVEEAPDRVRSWSADLVVVHPGASVSSETFRRLTWLLEDSNVSVGVSGVFDAVAPHRLTPGRLDNLGVLNVRTPRPSSIVRGVKAALDRALGALLLLLAAPLLVALAMAIRLDSPGPVLFKQARVGRNGRIFEVYKMRTMVTDAERLKEQLAADNEFDTVLFKMKRDPRTTRVGSFLRRSSLDELPQLINVVRGEMSLVGPRPYVPQEVAQMDPDVLRRHAVQPGITGLWQVSGRSDLDWDESAALDTYYADNWSLSGDAKIVARTVKAVVAAKGAY